MEILTLGSFAHIAKGVERAMEMTEQQIIETLATKVMGWTKYEIELDMADGSKQRFFDSWQLNRQDVAYQWDPTKNTADAMQLAEKAFGEEWTLNKHDGGYTFKGVTPLGKVGNAYHEETKEMAICNAALQTLEVGCNFLGECVCCNKETELMPIEEGVLGMCQDCATLCEP